MASPPTHQRSHDRMCPSRAAARHKSRQRSAGAARCLFSCLPANSPPIKSFMPRYALLHARAGARRPRCPHPQAPSPTVDAARSPSSALATPERGRGNMLERGGGERPAELEARRRDLLDLRPPSAVAHPKFQPPPSPFSVREREEKLGAKNMPVYGPSKRKKL